VQHLSSAGLEDPKRENIFGYLQWFHDGSSSI
jgi:hypothetical protein